MLRSFFISLSFLLSFMGFNVEAQMFRAGSLLRECREALKIQDFTKAVELADSVYLNSNNEITKLEAVSLAATANSHLGYLQKADNCYSLALDMAGEIAGIDDISYLNALFNYAQFLMLTGNYEKAIELTENMGQDKSSELTTELLSLRASALAFLGDTEAALQLMDHAYTESNGTTDYSKNVILQNRAFIKHQSGDYLGAIKDYNSAIKSLSGKNKGVAMASMALSMAKTGDFINALKEVNSALDILLPFGKTDEDYIIALRKKGEILNLSDDKASASKLMREFFILERERLKNILPTLSPQLRLNYWTKEKPLLSKGFLVAETDPALAMDIALLRRQSSLIGRKDMERVLHKIDQTSVDVAAALAKDEAAVAFVLFEDLNGKAINGAITLASTGEATFIPLFSQDSIYKENPIVGFSLYDAVTGTDPILKNQLYTDSILADALLSPIIKSLPSSVKKIHFAPEGIFHLWGIENMPFQGNDSIRLIRHFALNEITQSNEPIKTNPSFLLGGGFDYDDLPDDIINELPTKPKATPTDAYDNILRATGARVGSQIFPYLPGSRKEATIIARNSPLADVRFDLTEEGIKNSTKQYDIIHLATHGYTLDPGINISSRNETDSAGYDLSLWLSGIALSGANIASSIDGFEDGILSAREICDLDLSQTALIVLSACQTALGKVYDENASGLIRALKNAGVQTIVASLWEVDDQSTAMFMAYFHKGLAAGLNKHDAFISAQEKTRSHLSKSAMRKFSPASLASKLSGETINITPYSSPWYWAPFIIIDP